MAYDEALADRMRKALGKRTGLVERKMFGGFAFLMRGNMCVGVSKDEMIVRLDPDETKAAATKPGVRLFEVGGRRMNGWILVAQSVLTTDAKLGAWIKRAVTYNRTLPAKK